MAWPQSGSMLVSGRVRKKGSSYAPKITPMGTTLQFKILATKSSNRGTPVSVAFQAENRRRRARVARIHRGSSSLDSKRPARPSGALRVGRQLGALLGVVATHRPVLIREDLQIPRGAQLKSNQKHPEAEQGDGLTLMIHIRGEKLLTKSLLFLFLRVDSGDLTGNHG